MKQGDKIGRYEIIERVGRGGMGVLYRGRDPVLEREVAIKIMSGDFSADESAQARFFREARAAARLQHRNIVTIFEFAEDHGTPYIAMEFLRGQSLSARMTQDPPLTIVQKLDIVTQLCTGLHYAHEQGIVHRDVKPGNIWLLEDGTVKLLDFGIAKVAASTMTQGGGVLGSAAYMAPEQVAGREIDGRADVFAAGVVLYELLARRKPFEGEGPTAVMMKIIKEDAPPIRQFAPDIPTALANAVSKALQKDPDRRFMNAGDFGAELRLVRISLERTTETVLADAADMAQTMYVPPPGAASPSVTDVDPASAASLSGGTVRTAASAPASGGRFATWVAVAALAVSGILAAVVLLQRSEPSSAPAAAASQAAPAPAAPSAPAAPISTQAPAGAALVKLVSDPDGAAITIDGVETDMVTPADVSAEDLSGGRVGLTKRGYRPSVVRAGAAQIEKGVVLARLEPVPSGISVSLSGSYPFEVLQGDQVISSAARQHELKLAEPGTLRLRASAHLLNSNVDVRSGSGRFSYALPALGSLDIRSQMEQCTVRIAGRDFGYPPIAGLQVAPGSYTVELRCPEGDSPSKRISVAPGERARVVVP